MRDAERIFNAIDLASTACGNIQEKDRCEGCPINGVCLEGKFGTPASIGEQADLINVSTWEEFLRFADTCLPADYEERQREAWIDSLIDKDRDERMGL